MIRSQVEHGTHFQERMFSKIKAAVRENFRETTIQFDRDIEQVMLFFCAESDDFMTCYQ